MNKSCSREIKAQNEHDSLCALEPLMEEFFSAATSNSRKHEIEVQLGAFSSQRDSWKACIYFLNHTSSQYVSMYALSTIEVFFLLLIVISFVYCIENVYSCSSLWSTVNGLA